MKIIKNIIKKKRVILSCHFRTPFHPRVHIRVHALSILRA